MVDKTKITKGMYLTGGPPLDRGETTVKTGPAPAVDEPDVDEMGPLRESLDRSRRAIDALKTTRKQ
jgi:hypothetical protein